MKFELGEILPILSTLVGVIIGALIGELRDAREKSLDYKKDLNSSLFILLEIRELLMKLDLEKFVLASEELFDSKFGNSENKDINEFITELYKTFLINVLNENIYKNIIDAEENYQKALLTIARQEPFIAYELISETSLSEYLLFVEGFISKIDNVNTLRVNSKLRPVKSSTEILLRHTNKTLYHSALKDVDKSISTISKKISRKASKMIRNELKIQNKLDDEDYKRFFKNMSVNVKATEGN